MGSLVYLQVGHHSNLTQKLLARHSNSSFLKTSTANCSFTMYSFSQFIQKRGNSLMWRNSSFLYIIRRKEHVSYRRKSKYYQQLTMYSTISSVCVSERVRCLIVFTCPEKNVLLQTRNIVFVVFYKQRTSKFI